MGPVTGLPVPLAAVLGGGIGLGLALIAAGILPASPSAVGPVPSQPGLIARLRQRSYGDRILARTTLAAVAGVLVGAATGWPVGALLAAAAGLALPGLLLAGRQRSGQIARVEAVAGWAEMLRDTLAGAAGLEQAIVATAPVAPTAIREPVVALAGRLEHGGRLPQALRAFADEVADPVADLVVAALLLAADHQTRRLGNLLGTLAAAAREQVTVRLRIEAGRARTRTSVRVIVAATTTLVVGLGVLNRGYLAPYDSATGQLMLLAVGVLFAVAFGWLARMSRPTVPSRLLDPAAGPAAAGRREQPWPAGALAVSAEAGWPGRAP